MKKQTRTPKTVGPQTPTLTDAQKLELFTRLNAAEVANQQGSPQGIAEAIVQLLQQRQKAAHDSLAAVNDLLKRLAVPGYQLDPRTGTFHPQPQ
jgi:hypothetical protein